MTTENISKEKKDAQTNAGLAGAGSGTLVALIANQLPDSNVIKPILHLSAPSISILVVGLWVWLKVKIANYVRDREVDILIKKAKNTLEKEIANPHITEEYRLILVKQLEDINAININRIKSRIEALEIVRIKDIRRKQNVENISQSVDIN